MGKFSHGSHQERTRRSLNADNYPNEGNHIAIFECQLKQPPMFSINELSHREFLLANKINFVNWRLVDFDNYMLGNKHFTESETENPQGKYMEGVEAFYGDMAHKRKGAKQYADKKTKEALLN